VLAALMIREGLAGPDLASRNAATVLGWVHYRGLLIALLLVAGNLFCMACPFMLPRALARRLVAPVRQWPAALRNKWLGLALLVGVLFAYERLALWDAPALTAWLIVGYFGAALVIDSLFAHAPFCKYVCPIGQFNFVASTVSPLELRVAQPAVCDTCRTRDCIEGTPRGATARPARGCELHLFQPRKVGNLDCTLCLDCVYACPHDNIALASRVPASELWDARQRSGVGLWSERPDLAALVVVFTFGALVNAFAMTTPATLARVWFAGAAGTADETAFLGGLFTAGLIVEPLLLLGAAAWLTRRLAAAREGLLAITMRFVVTLVPIGVAIWAAHYGFHLATGLWTVVPVLQDTLGGYGLPLGEPLWHWTGIAPGLVAPVQQMLVLLGLLGSWLVAVRVAERDHPAATWRAALPWAGLAAVLAGGALWVFAQPMDMRGMMMM
jgi:ferredoxin